MPTINPSVNGRARMDNCVACTAAVVRNVIYRHGIKKFQNAHEVERKNGDVSRRRALSLNAAVDYLQRATGKFFAPGRVPFMDPSAPAGCYAIFGGRDGIYEHVVYGRVLPNGGKFLFDAQIGRRITWAELFQQYGGAIALRFES